MDVERIREALEWMEGAYNVRDGLPKGFAPDAALVLFEVARLVVEARDQELTLIEGAIDKALQAISDSDQWEYSHAVEYAATCAARAMYDRLLVPPKESGT